MASRRSASSSRRATTSSPKGTSSPTTPAASSSKTPTGTSSAETSSLLRTSPSSSSRGAGQNRITGNSFVGNLTPLTLVGKQTDTVFDGNYWSENREPDLDGDGRCDRPYRLGNVFDHFRETLLAADLFAQSFAAGAIGVAEETFPVLQQPTAMDHSPLARPPALPDVPRTKPAARAAHIPAVAASSITFLLGSALLVFGRRLPAA